jgi:hypothetical protein
LPTNSDSAHQTSMQQNREHLLFLTLVHPDFLPPVYATAQSLRDEGYSIEIVTFDSFTPADVELGDNIKVTPLGKHHNVPLKARMALRSKFKAYAQQQLKSRRVKAIVAFCPFSFNTAISIKGNVPVIYYTMEISDYTVANFKRSPLSTMSHYKAMHSLNEAALVATPSFQRSAWLAGRVHLDFMPETILNTAYTGGKQDAGNNREVLKNILPESVFNKKMLLYTGAVNDRLCIRELVEAFVVAGQDDQVLVVTGFKDNAYCNGIRQFVATARNKENIFLLPYVTREEMLALQTTADIGACLMKEIPGMIASKMLAPNKTGEYLAKGLYILGVSNFYMDMFGQAGVGTLAATPSVTDIAEAISKSFLAIRNPGIKDAIEAYVSGYFCMQVQSEPIKRALKRL